MTARWILLVVAALGAGCGERIVELVTGDDAPDAPPADAPACVPGTTQCTDCVDNDADGELDGFDIECTGSYDDDEGGFGTGRTGDQGGLARQDCFYDGDSGSGGQDACDVHTCCVVDDCASLNLPGPAYDPNDPNECLVTQACVDFCAPLTPPNCDCFGCCEVCVDTLCEDIFLHPGVAPDCDADTLADPALCPRCTRDPLCVTACDAADACVTSSDCDAARPFCAAGCCVAVVE